MSNGPSGRWAFLALVFGTMLFAAMGVAWFVPQFRGVFQKPWYWLFGVYFCHFILVRTWYSATATARQLTTEVISITAILWEVGIALTLLVFELLLFIVQNPAPTPGLTATGPPVTFWLSLLVFYLTGIIAFRMVRELHRLSQDHKNTQKMKYV